MTEDRTSSARLRHLLLIACGAILIAAYNYRHLVLGVAPRRNHPEVLAALCLLAVALRPLLSEAAFRRLFLAVSLGGAMVQLGLDSLAVFAFSGLVVGLARLKGPVLVRVLAALLAWAAGLLPKLEFSAAEFYAHAAFYVFWAGAAFSAIYVIVERARGALSEQSWADDLAYLVALPRLFMPFFQPISPSKFWSSRVHGVESRLVLRGLGLGLYGILLFFAMRKMPYIYPPRPDVAPLDHGVPELLIPAHNLVFIYASNASAIFCAVGLFRLLGFDLGSGFAFPLLSRSFAEFFRRWNYYIYEEVRSLFFFPLMGWLRRALPEKAAAVLASYVAIFLGMFGLNAIVIPASLNLDPRLALERTLQLDSIGFHALYWTGIILPQLLPWRQSASPPSLGRRVLQHATFIVLITLLTRAAYNAGVAIF